MLATLPPGDHTDPATRGLQLRVRALSEDPSRTWLLRYRWREQWVRMVIGHLPAMSLADARERAQELRRALGQGIDPRRARPLGRRTKADVAVKNPPTTDSKYSVAYLANEFTHRYLRSKRKRPEYAEATLARGVLPDWAHRDARTIEPGEIIELLDKIIDRGSPVAANRTAGLLSQMFRFGIHRRIVKSSPVQLLFPPGGKKKPRTRILSDDELRAFLKDPKDATRFDRLS